MLHIKVKKFCAFDHDACTENLEISKQTIIDQDDKIKQLNIRELPPTNTNQPCQEFWENKKWAQVTKNELKCLL